MKFKSSLLALLSLTLLSFSAYAASVRVTFDVSYESGFFSNKPNDEFRAKAMKQATLEVWKSYQGRMDTSKLAEIERSRVAIEARLGDFITNVDVLDETVNESSKRVKYTVRAQVNDALVSTIIKGASGAPAASGAGSVFAFLFVPRMQSEAKEFDATVSKTQKVTAATQVKEVSKDSVTETEGGVTEKSTQGAEAKAAVNVKTSGDITRKAQETSWVVVEAKGVNAEVSKVLTESGYEPTSADDLFAADCAEKESSSEALLKDMMSRSNLTFSRNVSRMLAQTLNSCEVKFFGLGYMDIDSIQKDDQSGGWRVRVSVNVQVKDYSAKLPKTVATVQEASASIGVSQDAARDKALKDASRKVAEIIVSQMRAKGLN